MRFPEISALATLQTEKEKTKALTSAPYSTKSFNTSSVRRRRTFSLPLGTKGSALVIRPTHNYPNAGAAPTGSVGAVFDFLIVRTDTFLPGRIRYSIAT